jgi:anti-sigma factor RsiW
MVKPNSNTADEIACLELVQVITAYLEGTLGADDRRRFDAHLEECPWCVNYVAQMRQMIAALGELPADSIAPARRREILDAFRDWRRAG